MTEQELQAIKERVEKATPGPWGFDKGKKEHMDRRPAVIEVFVEEENEWFISGDISDLKDAEFIAHAREDIPALIAEVERLQKALKTTDADLYVYKDLYNEMTDKSIELIKFLQTRISKGWGKKAVDLAMAHIQEQENEIERLRATLEYYADEKHYEPYGFDSYGCDVTEDGGMIARKALAGDSDAI